MEKSLELPSKRNINDEVSLILKIKSVRFTESKVFYEVEFPCGELVEIDSANF